MAENQLTQIWNEYQQGLDYLNSINLFSRVEDCHNFTCGDQWRGLRAGNERPSQLNILQPIMKSSTALVGQNSMSVHFTSMNFGEDRETLLKVCDKLNEHASRTWERLKIDRMIWDVLQDAFIAGDSFLYFFQKDEKMEAEQLDATNVMFADEQNPNIQEQPYILIIQRRYVSDVLKEAKENGIPRGQMDLIVPDSLTDLQVNGQVEVQNNTKTTSIMKMWKEEGQVFVERSVKNLVYQKKTLISGMTLYPIAKYSWKVNKGSARGLGDIWDKIPNQIAINKSLYRFESAVKASAYPHKVYNSSALSAEDVKKLNYPDSNIAVSDFSGQGVEKLVSYLQPASISPYARNFWQDMITITRDLSGAGDNLENVNPEQASGAAINAAREAKALNVNMQVNAFKQFVEDMALIWYDLWVTYSNRGLDVITADKQGKERKETISQDTLRELKIDVRIDVSPANPYSKVSQEMGLKELFSAGAITFEEYVAALDDDAVMPKRKLQDILAARQSQQNKQAAMKMMEMSDVIQQMQQKNSDLTSQAAQGQTAASKLVQLTQALKSGKGAQAGNAAGAAASGSTADSAGTAGVAAPSVSGGNSGVQGFGGTQGAGTAAGGGTDIAQAARQLSAN